MAFQVDVIPATGGPYFTSNIEDGIAWQTSPSAGRLPRPGQRPGLASRRAVSLWSGSLTPAEARGLAVLQPRSLLAAFLALTR